MQDAIDVDMNMWAVDALGGLAHETRLGVFRALVRAGQVGMIAGAISTQLGIPGSTMSHHLATLERAGLVQSTRESRAIRYRADFAGMRQLLGFLLRDCCQGAPDLCADLLDGVLCAVPPPKGDDDGSTL